MAHRIRVPKLFHFQKLEIFDYCDFFVSASIVPRIVHESFEIIL